MILNVPVRVKAEHQHDFEYMANVKLGDRDIWSGLVYGTNDDGKTHSGERACKNALWIVAERLRRMLDD